MAILLKELLNDILNPIDEPSQVEGSRIPLLSSKQQEILKLICQGYSIKEIGDIIKPPLTQKNIEYHRAMIKAKLGVNTFGNVATTELTRIALKYFPHLLADRPQAAKIKSVKDIFHLLTPQQLAVFKMYIRGYDTYEIAKFLKISPKTIEFHRFRLFRKLGINDPADITALGIKLGIIEPSSQPGKIKQ